jgi:hypothetical protein
MKRIGGLNLYCTMGQKLWFPWGIRKKKNGVLGPSENFTEQFILNTMAVVVNQIWRQINILQFKTCWFFMSLVFSVCLVWFLLFFRI